MCRHIGRTLVRHDAGGVSKFSTDFSLLGAQCNKR